MMAAFCEFNLYEHYVAQADANCQSTVKLLEVIGWEEEHGGEGEIRSDPWVGTHSAWLCETLPRAVSELSFVRLRASLSTVYFFGCRTTLIDQCGVPSAVGV